MSDALAYIGLWMMMRGVSATHGHREADSSLGRRIYVRVMVLGGVRVLGIAMRLP